MFLLLSGEGPTDIGVSNEAIGPMSKFIDHMIARRSQYSLLECSAYKIISEHELAARSKRLKARSRRGKKAPAETRYYFKNARAMALILQEESQARNWEMKEMIPVLFRDTDNRASSGRGEWKHKWESILNGFQIEKVETGVPMLPKPKSEAWLLCALRQEYQHCESLENESGNDNSPNNLKQQLEIYLGQPFTRELLNEKIDQGEIDVHQIVDMPSLNAFKQRLNEVLDRFLAPNV